MTDDSPIKCGKIVISVEMDEKNKKPLFSIESDDSLFDIKYIIEDTLKMY